MVPKWSQNNSKMAPKSYQICSKTVPWRLFGPKWLQDAEVGGKIDPRLAKSCQLGAKMG